MIKSERTKQIIIKESSILFNTKGYKNTSLSDITEVSGYTKGAIYRHFENKEALESESFSYMSSMVLKVIYDKIKDEKDVFVKMDAVFNFFISYINNPIIKGGCPLLNLAIEVDDSNNILKEKAANFLKVLETSIKTILANGIKFKQLKQETDIVKLSVIIISSLEGAIMMSKLKNSNKDVIEVSNYLKELLFTYKY